MAVKRIDHIAIVVPNIEEAESFYRDALGLDLALVEEVEGQEVIVAFFPTRHSPHLRRGGRHRGYAGQAQGEGRAVDR